MMQGGGVPEVTNVCTVEQSVITPYFFTEKDCPVGPGAYIASLYNIIPKVTTVNMYVCSFYRLVNINFYYALFWS
jgi:hypothetical protein